MANGELLDGPNPSADILDFPLISQGHEFLRYDRSLVLSANQMSNLMEKFLGRRFLAEFPEDRHGEFAASRFGAAPGTFRGEAACGRTGWNAARPLNLLIDLVDFPHELSSFRLQIHERRGSFRFQRGS